MIIRRRGRSHRCRCSCGWTGRAWNELRPAEADAWEHVYGTDCIVDLDTVGGLESDALDSEWSEPRADRPHAGRELVGAFTKSTATLAKVEELIRHARSVAGGPSPYSQHARDEIWHLAARDPTVIRSAISEVDELLERHSRRNASTADAEWLELITTKRLLADSAQLSDSDS